MPGTSRVHFFASTLNGIENQNYFDYMEKQCVTDSNLKDKYYPS
jgi:hypothetical protein